MKKVLVFMLVLLVACAPISFAACQICTAADSNDYAKAAVGKLTRGIANAAFGWVELFRQPAINKNAWEGVGKGVVYTIGRTGSGILEAATFIIPGVKVPLPDPTCPIELMGSSSTSKA